MSPESPEQLSVADPEDPGRAVTAAGRDEPSVGAEGRVDVLAVLQAGRQHRTFVRGHQGLTEHVLDGGRRLSPCGVDREEEAQLGIDG